MAKKAKKKAAKKQRPKHYEQKLAINGTLDEVLKASIDFARKPEKK